MFMKLGAKKNAHWALTASPTAQMSRSVSHAQNYAKNVSFPHLKLIPSVSSVPITISYYHGEHAHPLNARPATSSIPQRMTKVIACSHAKP